MRVGVTGGTGFIGGYVLEELLTRGHEPLVFDHMVRANVAGADVMVGDIRDATAVTELAAHVDGIIHLAAVLGTQETIANPRPSAETNVLGGLNVLEALAQHELPGVYIAVGNHHALNSYSISKTCVERYVGMFNADRGGRVNVVRAVNAYGPRQAVAPPFGPAKVRKIMPAFVCRALSDMPVEVYGDGSQVSDMVWVGDLAKALVRALELADAGPPIAQVIEVGPDEPATVESIAARVIRASTPAGREPVKVKHLPMRPGELPGAKVSADTSLLPLIGMHARELLPLDEGIRRTVAWYATNEGVAWKRP